MHQLPPELIHLFVQYLTSKPLFKYLLATYATNTQLQYHICRRYCLGKGNVIKHIMCHTDQYSPADKYLHESTHWCIEYNGYPQEYLDDAENWRPIADRIGDCFLAANFCDKPNDQLCKGCVYYFKQVLSPANTYLDVNICQRICEYFTHEYSLLNYTYPSFIINTIEMLGFNLLEHQCYIEELFDILQDLDYFLEKFASNGRELNIKRLVRESEHHTLKEVIYILYDLSIDYYKIREELKITKQRLAELEAEKVNYKLQNKALSQDELPPAGANPSIRTIPE